jgi:hypothetical protein
MKYRVFWTPDAEGWLEEILRNSADQEIGFDAAREIDRALTLKPLAFGESRSENIRIGFKRPLGIHFEVLGLALWSL